MNDPKIESLQPYSVSFDSCKLVSNIVDDTSFDTVKYLNGKMVKSNNAKPPKGQTKLPQQKILTPENPAIYFLKSKIIKRHKT